MNTMRAVIPFRRVRLHSSDPASRWNFAGGACDGWMTFDPATSYGYAEADGDRLASDDPLALLDWMAGRPSPNHRWIGFISYGLRHFIEALPHRVIDDLELPLLQFGRFAREAEARPIAQDVPAVQSRARFEPPTKYLDSVRKVIDYIAAGDVFQVNLSQRIAVRTPRPAEEVWSVLCARNPATHGAFLQSDSFSIISNSPELFFSIEPRADGTRRIVNRPIKGTRPRGPGMRDELVHSAKDIAELAMIVDLQRNDLGRVCEIGSVKVEVAREIETHPTVHHGVATIAGTLRRDARLSHIMRAMFPCGSITGCPKIRAMEIIEELESVERGPYCGAIGYLDPDGTVEFNVAIRTTTMKDGVAYVPVGGGIVADSTPEGEYDETLAKAAAMLTALGVSPASDE